MHWRIPLFAACLMGSGAAAGADLPRTFGRRWPVRGEIGKHHAPGEAIVFQDSDYDPVWVEDSDSVASWFVRRGFVQKNVPELETWLTEKISADSAVGTSVVFAMGIAPTSIVYPPYEDCLLAHYVKAGGRVVWLGNIPMYVAQGETGSKITYGEVPRKKMLGLFSDPQTYYGAEGPTLTSTGLAWGLEPGNGLVRPVLNQGLKACFFSDPSGEHCGVGLVNMRPDVPTSGFIFMPDYLDPSREGLLRNAYRLAQWSNAPVKIPEPAPLAQQSLPWTASLRFGADDTRTTFLRGESVALYLRAQSRGPGPFAGAVRVLMNQDGQTLAHWGQTLTFPLDERDVFLGYLDLRDLRRDEYQIQVSIAPALNAFGSWGADEVTLTRDLRIAQGPDHEGTHVALWVDASPAPRRTMHLLDWLDEHELQPLFADDSATGRDLALWYGMSFSVRRLGNSTNAPAPPGYDSWRRGANGEILPVAALGNKRVSMGYANPFRRQLEADDFGRQIVFDAAFPAFRRRAVTSDDYSQFFGLDYNTFATEGFFARYGIEAPRPPMLGDSDDLSKVPPPPPGIVNDDDPWLLLNRYWCEDVHGDMALRLSAAMSSTTEGMGKVGQISGGMQIPVMYVPSGQYPPYSMGTKGYSLLSFYYYNQLWQPPLAHLWWLEVARMGNRGRETWIMPDSGYEGENASALYHHFGWLMLAGGATGIQYFNDDSKTPGGVAAMTTFGGLSKEYGRLLAKLVPAPKKVALLVPFEQLVYKPASAFELLYPYMDLLQAKVDVEPVSPDELDLGNIQRYSAIIVAQTSWLKASTAALLSAYAQNGGKLILDAPSAAALPLPGAITLPLRLGGTSIAETSNPTQIANTRAVLASLVVPPVDCDDPQITLRRFDAGGTPYLYVNHQLTNAEYLAYRQSKFENEALADRLGYERDIVLARIVRPDDRRFPYDVLAHRILPMKRHHGQLEFVLPVPKWQGRIVAFLPEVPRRIQLLVPPRTTPGLRTSIRVRMLGQRGEVDSYFPLHLTVTDPRGQKNKEYSQRSLARKGVATVILEFARNDMPGRWTIAVRDAMTGLEARTTIELERDSGDR